MGNADYKEILKMKSRGYGKRQIAASVHSSHHTVTAVLDAAEAKSIHWLLESEVSNENLGRILFPEKQQASSRYAERDYTTIHKELAKPA